MGCLPSYSIGRIWLTTIDQGIVTFTPEQVKINETPPKIVLTDFRVFNESLAQGEGSPLKEDISVCKEIHLEHWQNDISIECTALHFSNPQKNQYAFWLENYDDDWYKNGTNRTASYTNLNPGEYIFHARAANSDNIWYTEGISLRIIINPPWWKTAWAYISYILTLILIVFLVWKQQMRRVQLRHELRMKQFEAEKLHEVDQLKSRFFVNISHEFRTPLTLIIGPLEQLISEAMKEKWKKQLKLVYNNSRQLLQLINQLLDFSKLEEGRMTLKAAEVNIIPLLKGLVYSFDSMARRKKIELTFHSEYEHIPVYVDKDKLEKIVSNLLSNAFKFTAVGGKIAVKAIQIPGVEEKNSILEIHVSDTGLGIGKEHLSHIFDRYYQADKKRRQTGTGIGLALVKELVELHHGHITAESEPGKGSLFILQLPLGRAHLTSEEIASDLIDEYNQTEWMKEETMIEEVHTLPVKEAGSKDRNKPLILVVEDTEDVRIYIRDLLISGYRVAEADDGETGLEKAFNILPDLIISDVMLPGMDGFVLCEKLKTDEHTSHIPIILLTARASEDSKLEGLETGADDYLVKPFNSKELKVRIGNLIEQRRKLRERFIRDVNLSPKELAFTSADERFLEKALSIIENRMSDPLFGVGDLSKEINMSISSLYRKILALTGQSPIEFIRTFRLKRAANLLKQKYGNIAQITYEVGFNNPSYFARCFRQQYGVSPSEYAKIL
jgi:signal transduction histidine kinase/AraC-like DNA-binding protein